MLGVKGSVPATTAWRLVANPNQACPFPCIIQNHSPKRLHDAILASKTKLSKLFNFSTAQDNGIMNDTHIPHIEIQMKDPVQTSNGAKLLV